MTPPRFGPALTPEGTRFVVWAPRARAVELLLDGRVAALSRVEGGRWAVTTEAPPGTRYRLRLDGGVPMPDPASRSQPEGVHGPSEVVDLDAFEWTRPDWPGVPRSRLRIYELHVGTFTPQGTYAAAASRLPELADLGVTAVELMPVHDFPGERGWGYDPAAWYAPCRAYGRPEDLQRFVDEAHAHGLSVLLDVVYNHVGPDGAYVCAFGPVLRRKRTPWGQALNLADRGLRDLILDNARYWLREYRFDGLRLDATDRLHDEHDPHLLAELRAVADAVEGPPRLLIAEDGRNLEMLLRPLDYGGMAMDAVWADDLHHIVRRIVAGDRHGYFAGVPDTVAGLAECLRHRWWRGARDVDDVPAERFVAYLQNHDQIGNRARGDRLHESVDLATVRAATALLLFCAHTPLLFMGQEHAASTPFSFFSDHGARIGPTIAEGRKREMAAFPGFDGDVPDPQARSTFEASTLRWDERARSPHAEVLALHRALLGLRDALRGELDVRGVGEGGLSARRGAHHLAVQLVGAGELAVPPGARRVLSTEEPRFGGDPSTVTRRADRLVFARPAAVVLTASPAPARPGSTGR